MQSTGAGTAVLGGSFVTFTPAPGFIGFDSFQYTVSDGNGGFDVGFVGITINAANCGNGILQDGEECDTGGESSICDADCTLAICGDARINTTALEQCDDGNTISGDGCSAVCLVEFCGDGIVQVLLGEECDDGNNQNGDNCSADCTIENFLINGSFETADYTGWILRENSGNPVFGIWGIGSDGDVLVNGNTFFDFHDGIEVVWEDTGCNTPPLNLSATDGVNVSFLLVNGPENHRIFQDVFIPAGATTLSWDMMYQNENISFDPNSQFLAINVRDPATDAILSTLFKTTEGVDPPSIPMTGFSANLSPFAGQTVRIDVEMQVQTFCFEAVFDNFALQ